MPGRIEQHPPASVVRLGVGLDRAECDGGRLGRLQVVDGQLEVQLFRRRPRWPRGRLVILGALEGEREQTAVRSDEPSLSNITSIPRSPT